MILLIKDVEKSILGNFERYSAIKKKLEKLDGNVVVVGSHTSSDNRKEKVSMQGSLILHSEKTLTQTIRMIAIDGYSENCL